MDSTIYNRTLQYVAIYQIERKNAIIQEDYLGELCPLNGSSAERGTKRTKDLDRSQHQERPALHGATRSERMCGVRKLTRAAYANQRMTLDRKSAKFQDKAEYDDRAT